MANRDEIVPRNVDGAFYVDNTCILCGVCFERAPDNFAEDEDEGWAYVKRQPENDEELELAQEVMESCPVEAIGDDGED
jgi:ferredoxin